VEAEAARRRERETRHIDMGRVGAYRPLSLLFRMLVCGRWKGGGGEIWGTRWSKREEGRSGKHGEES
jgi:hypothetical protein